MADTVTIKVTDSTGASATAVFTLPLAGSVATPTFSPVAGTYPPSQSITISCSTPSSTIYYTLDGSTPTPSSSVYSAPIPISINTVVNAMATASGLLNSSVGSATYLLTLTPEWP